MGAWFPQVDKVLDDIWNAISTPPGSTTPILAPDDIRTPEEVLNEEIIPALTEPGAIPESIINDLFPDADIEIKPFDELKTLLDFGFGPKQSGDKFLGVGLGKIALGVGALAIISRY